MKTITIQVPEATCMRCKTTAAILPQAFRLSSPNAPVQGSNVSIADDAGNAWQSIVAQRPAGWIASPGIAEGDLSKGLCPSCAQAVAWAMESAMTMPVPVEAVPEYVEPELVRPSHMMAPPKQLSSVMQPSVQAGPQKTTIGGMPVVMRQGSSTGIPTITGPANRMAITPPAQQAPKNVGSPIPAAAVPVGNKVSPTMEMVGSRMATAIPQQAEAARPPKVETVVGPAQPQAIMAPAANHMAPRATIAPTAAETFGHKAKRMFPEPMTPVEAEPAAGHRVLPAAK